jgi:hypothetical protein
VLAECLRDGASKQARPLHRPKRFGHLGLRFGRIIDTHRHDERLAARHEQRALIGKMPFETEVGLGAARRVARNHWHEQRTVAQLLPDPVIPGVATLELATVEPRFHPGGAQR